ncbi:receptor-like protein EIX1 [Pistacia vera]|uniref:receptor-like protein EIX1 n=1 Tax=Pistacia vera TaxID=55513 RepID=UPI001262ED51|nr:receptor-like protein EIX1 [Pistacia vera]
MSIVVLVLALLALATINFCFCSNRSTHLNCIESERQALLKLKQDFGDESNMLASWSGDGNCCSWAGVICDNLTGHVLELHLEGDSARFLRGKINPSLADLKDLVHLDLSNNCFVDIIPPFLGSMKKLRYLNLSYGGFRGMIPPQLGNLSDLQYLDLSTHGILTGMIPHQLGNLSNLRYLDLRGGIGLNVENLSWLSGLSLMEHLDLSGVNLTKSSDGLLVINRLPLLQVLKLSTCQLHHFPPLPIANFSSLTILDLSLNQLGTSIPSWIFGLKDLIFLSLYGNDFQGPIPNGLQNLTSLRHFDLSGNLFNSSIPDWLHKFSFLEFFSLERSPYDFIPCGELEGSIPRSWGRLCNLRSLDLSCVKLNQTISEILDIFSGCVSNGLVSLALNQAQLFGHLTDQFGKLKNLVSIDLSYNSIVGYVPDSLGQLSSLEEVDLSFNKLEGTISEIHFVNLTRLYAFDVSENSLSLKVSPDWIPPFQLGVLGLRSCHLGSRFPSWLPLQKNLFALDISNSTLVDTISIRFWEFFSQISVLNLSHNQIHGEIPNLRETAPFGSLFLQSNSLSGPLPNMSSLRPAEINLSNNNFSGSIFQFLCSGFNNLEFLNLKGNFLFGELPDCWEYFKSLKILDLGNNKFTGNLPTSIGNLDSLQSLHLRRNKLSGPLPMSFRNLANLKILDISQNEFVGKVPAWIGETFSRMIILNLRSNKFYDVLPVELCQLSSLQILDLAYNNFFGRIPACLNNFSAMATKQYSIGDRYLFNEITGEKFIVDVRLVMKDKWRNIALFLIW